MHSLQEEDEPDGDEEAPSEVLYVPLIDDVGCTLIWINYYLYL